MRRRGTVAPFGVGPDRLGRTGRAGRAGRNVGSVREGRPLPGTTSGSQVQAAGLGRNDAPSRQVRPRCASLRTATCCANLVPWGAPRGAPGGAPGGAPQAENAHGGDAARKGCNRVGHKTAGSFGAVDAPSGGVLTRIGAALTGSRWTSWPSSVFLRRPGGVVWPMLEFEGTTRWRLGANGGAGCACSNAINFAIAVPLFIVARCRSGYGSD